MWPNGVFSAILSGMKTLSLDIRTRILACYDERKHTRDAIAKRFCVSLGVVKKLLRQRKATGEIGDLYHRAGRKPTITQAHRREMAAAIRERPDVTLAELRDRLGLGCSLAAIHHALDAMGMTYKKRRSGLASRTETTSGKPVSCGPKKSGSGRRGASCSSTNRARRRT